MNKFIFCLLPITYSLSPFQTFSGFAGVSGLSWESNKGGNPGPGPGPPGRREVARFFTLQPGATGAGSRRPDQGRIRRRRDRFPRRDRPIYRPSSGLCPSRDHQSPCRSGGRQFGRLFRGRERSGFQTVVGHLGLELFAQGVHLLLLGLDLDLVRIRIGTEVHGAPVDWSASPLCRLTVSFQNLSRRSVIFGFLVGGQIQTIHTPSPGAIGVIPPPGPSHYRQTGHGQQGRSDRQALFFQFYLTCFFPPYILFFRQCALGVLKLQLQKDLLFITY